MMITASQAAGLPSVTVEQRILLFQCLRAPPAFVPIRKVSPENYSDVSFVAVRPSHSPNVVLFNPLPSTGCTLGPRDSSARRSHPSVRCKTLLLLCIAFVARVTPDDGVGRIIHLPVPSTLQVLLRRRPRA